MKKVIWREFNQAELRATVQGIVNREPFDQPFAAPLVSDLIAERHYFCSLRGIRPEQFKKTHEDPFYRFYGLFPRVGWHPVSWTKCLSALPTPREIIEDALRARIKDEMAEFRRRYPRCMRCPSAVAAETHHASPTFQEIMDRVFSSITVADVAHALTTWDWFKKAEFLVPEGHVIVRRFDPLHATATLEALCKPCHNATKRRCRVAEPSVEKRHRTID